MWWSFLKFEFRSILCRPLGILLTVALFLMAAAMHAIALPVSVSAPGTAMGMLWVSFLLVLCLPYCGIFNRDAQNGLLEQWALLPLRQEWLLLAKYAALWSGYALPLLIVCAPLLLFTGLVSTVWQVLAVLAVLASGSVALLCLAALFAASGRSSSRANSFVSFLCIALLSLPVVFRGAEAAIGSVRMTATPETLFLLPGYTLLLLPFSLLASARLLRCRREG